MSKVAASRVFITHLRREITLYKDDEVELGTSQGCP